MDAAEALLQLAVLLEGVYLAYFCLARTRSCSRVEEGETTPFSSNHSRSSLSDHLTLLSFVRGVWEKADVSMAFPLYPSK